MNFDEKIIKLEKLYSDLTREGSLGGVYPLLEISNLCKSICLDSNPKKILPSFILHTTFKTLAGWQDEKETLVSDCENLYNKLNSSIITLINDLKNLPKDDVLIKDIEILINNLNKL